MSASNIIQKNVICRVASVSVDLNGAAGTETALYTVPTGYTFIPVMVVIRDVSADAASAAITLGKTGGACDEFLGDQTLSGLDGATKVGVLQQVPNATTVDSVEFTAGHVFGVEITTAAGSASTATFDVFGYLY